MDPNNAEHLDPDEVAAIQYASTADVEESHGEDAIDISSMGDGSNSNLDAATQQLLSPREQELLAQEVSKAMQQSSSSMASSRGKLASGAAAMQQGSGASSSSGSYPAATLLMQSLADIKQAANAWKPGEHPSSSTSLSAVGEHVLLSDH
jgi:hypothetical protein